MCNGIPAFAITDPAEHGYSESISTLQKSLHPGTTLSIANAISTEERGFVKINFRSAKG